MDIRQRMGMVRGKNDRIDALRIADYAMRFQDKKREAGPATLAMLELKQLLAFRDRMVAEGVKHGVYNSDLNTCVAKPLQKVFKEYSARRIKDSKAMVMQVDRMIKDHIAQDPIMQGQYQLLLTIPRVGPVLAAHLLAATELFTRMCKGRQLACHAGVAPHEHTSGSSIKGRSRVSHHADKRLKSLLHMAALGMIQCDNELSAYYRRKVADGKHPMSVLNAIRCKIILRVCAVIREGRPYEPRKAEPVQAVPAEVGVTSTISTNFTTSGQTEAGHAGEQPARDQPDERRASAMGGETKGLPAQARSSSCLTKLNKRLEMS
jgi:transposase